MKAIIQRVLTASVSGKYVIIECEHLRINGDSLT